MLWITQGRILQIIILKYMLYKVIKEEGVVVDTLNFEKGALIDLDSDAFNIPELLAEGAIVEDEAVEDEAVEDEPVLDGEAEPKTE